MNERIHAPPTDKPRIVVIGSSNTDLVIRLDRLPRPGETILGGEFLSAAGGKGANQAVAAARAGGEVTFVARVGQDKFGDDAVARFVAEGIQVEHVFRDEGVATGVAFVFLARDGENSIAVAPGANGRLAPADLRRAQPVIAGASALLIQLETPLDTVEEAVELAAGAKVPVILNPAPAQALPARLLKRISILTPNETECERLTGIAVTDEASAARAAQVLCARGVGAVILTLGARGLFVASASSSEWIPAYQVKVSDTTGAGDVFNGALAVALGEGRPLLEAARFANAAAAISVTRFGAQPSAPKRKEIHWVLGSTQAGFEAPTLLAEDGVPKADADAPPRSPKPAQPAAEFPSGHQPQPAV